MFHVAIGSLNSFKNIIPLKSYLIYLPQDGVASIPTKTPVLFLARAMIHTMLGCENKPWIKEETSSNV